MYDVVIVGGGISGLYAAWRLGTTTTLKVAVLEADKRFGGRYQACVMPGGFTADFGAMRFLPLQHKMLYQLIKEMDLKIERLFDKAEMEKNRWSGYLRNRRVKDFNDFKKIYSVTEQDYPYFRPANQKAPINIPPNGNIYEGTVASTGQRAMDMSRGQFMSLTANADTYHGPSDHYVNSIIMADETAWLKQFALDDVSNPLSGYHCVKGGMVLVIDRLVERIKSLPNVTLLTNAMVTGVVEEQVGFTVSTENSSMQPLRGKKLILACNSRGIELISWTSPYKRTTQFQRLFSKVEKSTAVKVFLTYDRAWWEDAGLFSGYVDTDLPIAEVTAFGHRSKGGNFATLLAAFTYRDVHIFEGLNQSRYKRFEPAVGEIPAEFLPSEILVDYVQNQLKAMFSLTDLPSPVSASIKIWMSDPIAAANHHTRPGFDTYQLQFQVLKPFPESSMYITGDTFSAVTNVAFIGWSESSLINTERVLVHHFGLDQYCKDVVLHNQFPQAVPASKL